MQHLANFLRAYMEEHSLSLREMEQRAQVSRSLLNNLINGKETEPKLSTLKGIAQAVGLPLWRVIELAGVSLELPNETSYEAERLALMAQKSKIFSQLWPKLLYAHEAKLYNVLNYLESPNGHQVHHAQVAFIDERYQSLTEELMALVPTLLADVPPRANIYEGRRIPRGAAGATSAFVTVNEQSLTEVLSWDIKLEWGFAGKGPNDLASAILRNEYGYDIEDKFAAAFFRTVTMALPREHPQLGVIWQLESQQLDLWLVLMKLREQVQTRGESDRT